MLQAGGSQVVGHQIVLLTGPTTKTWPLWDPKNC